MTRPLRILTRTLMVLGLSVALLVAPVMLVVFTESGTRWVLNRVPGLLLDTGIALQWRAVGGTLATGLRIEALDLQTVGASRNALQVETLEFRWQPLRLPGTLVLDSVVVEGLDYGFDGDPAAPSEPLTETTLRELLFALPFSVQLHNLDSSAVTLRFGETNIAFDQLSATLLLDNENLAITGLDWQQGETRVTGNATLDSALALTANLDWQVRAGEVAYAGNLELGGTLMQLQATHALQLPAAVATEGSVVPGLFATPLTLDLQHRFNNLPLAPWGQPEASLPEGALLTVGTLEALRISGAVSVQWPGFEPAELNVDLLYGGDTLALTRITIDSAQIAANASGSLNPAPLALQLDWQLQRLDTGASLPDLQLAGLSGEGSVDLTLADEALAADITLARLSGELNGYPLALSGDLQVADAQLANVELQLDTGDNHLQLSGSTVPTLDLRWSLQAPALAQLWQGLSGTLGGQGAITGTLDVPEINGGLQGTALEFASGAGTFQLESLALVADSGASGNDISLQLQNLQMQSAENGEAAAQMLLQNGTVNISGTPLQHSLGATLTAPTAALGLALQGTYTDGNWQGTLQTAELGSRHGDWSLEEAATLAWREGAPTVSEHCWRYQLTRVCAQAGSNANGGVDATASITALPLGWLNPAGTAMPAGQSQRPPGVQDLLDTFALNLPANLLVEGQADLQLQVRNFADGSWDSVDLEVQPSDLVLQLTQTEEALAEEALSTESALLSLAPLVQRFHFYDNQLSVHNSAGEWRGVVAFQIAREEPTGNLPQGGLRAEASMDAAEALAGELAFAFADLSWLESVAPQLRDPAGALNGLVTLGGARTAPRIDSQLRLQDGSFGLPEYGLAVSAVDIALQNVAADEITLQASASSGEGTLALQARIIDPLQDARTVTATLSGTDFLAFNMDYATAALSPDLQVSYATEGISVLGRVDVPMMEVDLEGLFGTLGDNVVSVSRDTVVVRTADGTEPGSGAQDGQIPLTVDVTLALGDAVTLRGFGLDATITGQLEMEQVPNRALLVYGELGIPEGSYEIYNQQLSTRNGRLMFFGNPANPVVDIRAFRETETAEVGMLLSGPINNMQGQLYSTPTLPESEILAMLVTGKSFNNVGAEDSDALLSAIANYGFERGQGLTSTVSNKLGLDTLTVGGGGTFRESSLGVGKYLTPDLLMSYKVGLFDRQAVLSINYSLTERLKLQVETGISQSVDISYTVEKD